MITVSPHMTEALQEHTLTEITGGSGPVRAYYLQAGNKRTHACLFTFTPEGITITGDMTLGEGRGLISTHGLSLGWWLSAHNPDYLCPKFLTMCWHRELCQRELLAYFTSPEADPEVLARVNPQNDPWPLVVESLVGHSRETTSEVLHSLKIPMRVLQDIGWGYDPSDAGWLVALHARFREAWPDALPVLSPNES